ncbi:Spy/CpxP family protein refolding chaperone [Nitrospinaceae bacterium]|nr:Spy/CpxP family protein refolding chaperone [Nitrospinaceae bacterium]
MLRLISRLATITIFSFLCALIYTNLAIADPSSTVMESLKGTGSTGSFSYEEDQRKQGAIGYGVNNQKHEGSKSKSYSHGLKGYSGHISGSESHKKSEGSKSKSYSHGKPGHGKSPHAYKGGHGYSHKKSEGSKSKSYSHGKPGHGKSPHAYKGGHGYSHKKSEGSKSKSYSHGKPGHGKSHHAYKGGYVKSYGHKKGSHGGHGGHGHSPFKHVMHYKNKLGLTDAQILAMKELDADFKKKIIQAKADHQIAHVELDLHVHSGKVDEAKIRAAGAKIVASKTNKIMAMIDAKIQLLNLLTAEQRQKMAKMH